MAGTLTHSPADVLRHSLVNNSLGTLPEDAGSWPIFVSNEPDHPDSVITIYDTTGIMHGREMVGGEFLEHPGVQLRIRDADHDTGYTKARALAVALDETLLMETVVVSSTVYVLYAVSRKGSVSGLGTETPKSKRHIFTINATISVRQL